ncbi:TraY domain-containing protein [Bradyrhizobium brasilense]|uniref:TraY domain-containing protein n=1 Tax=Bradyrhizobium brasilense TaxID=1419277 RepID=UPI0032220A63|nr:TraY domain-containing protein [Bradyrhizobium brasilense]
MVVRKRGRPAKPKSEKKESWINTRVSDVTRMQLEAEAKRTGRSLSAEIETRLEASFARKNQRNDYVRALSYLFDQAHELYEPEGKSGELLRSSPWWRQHLRASIITLLDYLIPPDEAAATDPPAPIKEKIAPRISAWEEGLAAGNVVLTVLEGATNEPEAGFEAGDFRYAMPQARKALGFKRELSRMTRAIDNSWAAKPSNPTFNRIRGD